MKIIPTMMKSNSQGSDEPSNMLEQAPPSRSSSPILEPKAAISRHPLRKSKMPHFPSQKPSSPAKSLRESFAAASAAMMPSPQLVTPSFRPATQHGSGISIQNQPIVEEQAPINRPMSAGKRPKSRTTKARISAVGATGMSVDKEFFGVLNHVPALPKTLFANDILNAPDREDFLQLSAKNSEILTKRIMNRLSSAGTVVGGKNTLSIVERAAKAYLPRHSKAAKPSTVLVNLDENNVNKDPPVTSQPVDVTDTGFNGFALDPRLNSGEVINSYFLFPDLFDFNIPEAEANSAPNFDLNTTLVLVDSDEEVNAEVPAVTAISPRAGNEMDVQLPAIVNKTIVDFASEVEAEEMDKIRTTDARVETPLMESFDFLFP